MAVVRLEALRGLKAALAAAVPEVPVGDIIVGQAAPGRKICFPSLAIDPVRFRYEPDQALEVNEPSPDRLVVSVGRFVATVQLRLVASNLSARYEIEQKLLDLFLGTEMRPGILLTTITTCPALGDFLAAWELDNDEWHNEKSFDTNFGAELVVTGLIPALVTRRGTYAIDYLRLGLTNDFDTAFTAATIGDAPTEVVQVNEDGSFTRV
jgi:hypothetical protein